MTNYINPTATIELYRDVYETTYFIDKSEFLNAFIPMVASFQELKKLKIGRPQKYVCVTRPRRFGKSVNAYMIASFFMKGMDTHDIFDDLAISKHPLYENHINKHDVIFMDLSDGAASSKSIDEYLDMIKTRMREDMEALYPNVKIDPSRSIADHLKKIAEETQSRFIFVLDEWDYPLYMPYMKNADKESYIKFLSELLKAKAYVGFCYMTGIMPINTYDIGTPLNMFYEFIMGRNAIYAQYFGFNDDEVDLLYRKYLDQWKDDAVITRRQLAEWYDGYCLNGKRQLYNPKSVIEALSMNYLACYWSSSGRYEEIYTFIEHDIDGSRDAVAILLTGEGYPVQINQYAAASAKMTNIDQVFSAMVVYGFLTYDSNEKKVYIPNKELMVKFEEMLRNNHSLGYLHTLYISSRDVLNATKNLEPGPVEAAVKLVHDKEISLFKYNDEDAYASIVNLVYIAARDDYEVTREARGGTGYADLLFRPKRKDDDILVIELKVDEHPGTR